MQDYTKAVKVFVEEHPAGVTAVLVTGRLTFIQNHYVVYLKVVVASLDNDKQVNMWHFKSEIYRGDK